MSDVPPTHVTIVQKNSSGCKILLIILGVIILIGLLIVGGCAVVGTLAVSKLHENLEEIQKEEEAAAKQIKVSGVSWSTASIGGDVADFEVTNNNDFGLKSIVVEVTFSDQKKFDKLIFREIGPKETIEVTNFMLAAPTSAKPVSLEVTRASKAR